MGDEHPLVELKGRDGYDRFNLKLVGQIAAACPDAAKVRNANGDLPLHAAIKARRVMSFDLLSKHTQMPRENLTVRAKRVCIFWPSKHRGAST